MWPLTSPHGAPRQTRRARLTIERLESRLCMDCTVNVPDPTGLLVIPPDASPRHMAAIKYVEAEALALSTQNELKLLQQNEKALLKAQSFLDSKQFDQFLEETQLPPVVGEQLAVLNAQAASLLYDLRKTIPQVVKDAVTKDLLPLSDLDELTAALRELPKNPRKAMDFLVEDLNRQRIEVSLTTAKDGAIAVATELAVILGKKVAEMAAVPHPAIAVVEVAVALKKVPEAYQVYQRVKAVDLQEDLVRSLAEYARVQEQFNTVAGVSIEEQLQRTGDAIASAKTKISEYQQIKAEAKGEWDCQQDSKFDGSYIGAFSGTVTYKLFGETITEPIIGAVSFTIQGRVITVTEPGSGGGSLTTKGKAKFAGGTGGIGIDGGSVSFKGGLTIADTGEISGSGSWNARFNIDGVKGTAKGTWSASRG